MQWLITPSTYLGVPLDRYRENELLWLEKTDEMRAMAEAWGGRELSIFARATICNVFLAAKIMYLLQALYCTRKHIQKFHRIFATFIWCSTWERTSRTNLFRRVKKGGLSLCHLFLQQVVSRFMLIRDERDPFLCCFFQTMLAVAMPDFFVSSAIGPRYTMSRFLREVVTSYRFLRARFSLEYLSNVKRKRLMKDLIESVFPVPLYRLMFQEGHGQDVLKRVKNMQIPANVKTFFFKLHTGTLPVKTWLEEKGIYVAWGSRCFLCNKAETIEHVFIDCNNAIFFWDILQRTLKIDLPLNPHGIRFLPPERDFEQMDVIFLLGLHAVWRSLLAYRHCDVKGRSVHEYFVEMVVKLRDVYKTTDCDEDVMSMLDALVHIKRV